MKIAALILLSILCNTAMAQAKNEAIKKPINTFLLA